ncbi:cysteine-rich receptor-like protein kinase 25 isoform X2 [Spinacia oleracea]|uniref:Cysteine-rich receptor-like protein kinase 25 isoform X2 n=1 Tax=Spinacia oleracea TaxID=3562 RepID=A0ABM3R0J4_SPIOL|nr:cysteine-rich receptor-like protein kinase 25 isoform X2 [Spinacia oleracea]
MNSKLHIEIILLIFPITILLFASPTKSQPTFSAYICGDPFFNYTINNPTYKANLHTLLSSLISNWRINNYGFYNNSVGHELNQVYGVALCRGDVPTSDCKVCVDYAAARIALDCPTQNSAIGWYEECMIRYSNNNIFKGEMSHPRFNITSRDYNKVPDPKSFNLTISNLMNKLALKAASGDSRRKFATGEVNVSSKLRVYALLQCIPDLEEYDCLNCLNLIINYTIADCCYAKEGVRTGGPTCNVRYENYPFYKSAIELPPLQPPSTPSALSPPSPFYTRRKGWRIKRRPKISIIVIISVFMISVLLGILIRLCLKRRGRSLYKVENEEAEDDYKMIESLQLEFGVVKAATNNFSNSNKLGQGGFGTVYKGRLPSGQFIAVKRLSTSTGQGEKEFKNEALLVAKLQHKNLVRFLGFCLLKEERLLIYEFLPNKSLDHLLFDSIKRKYLDWENRYNIIGGIARGLLYLHEESRLLVVHRDIKAGNVLLDAEMNPKISDFGVARLFGVDQSQAYTSKIAGTCGYMPPEYVIHGNFSIKSDVFSFGVLVLEIISGQKVSKFSQAQNGDSLLSFAWRNWTEGNAMRLVDSTIAAINTNEVLRCIHIALLCVQENASQRPIMSSVVLMLNSYSTTIPVPSRPAFQVNAQVSIRIGT